MIRERRVIVWHMMDQELGFMDTISEREGYDLLSNEARKAYAHAEVLFFQMYLSDNLTIGIGHFGNMRGMHPDDGGDLTFMIVCPKKENNMVVRRMGGFNRWYWNNVNSTDAKVIKMINRFFRPTKMLFR